MREGQKKISVPDANQTYDHPTTGWNGWIIYGSSVHQDQMDQTFNPLTANTKEQILLP